MTDILENIDASSPATPAVPIREVTMHEVPAEDRERVAEAFRLLVAHEIPAIALRAAGVIVDLDAADLETKLAKMHQITQQGIADATGSPDYEIDPPIWIPVDNPDTQDVGLHADSKPGLNPGEQPAYHVHTTTSPGRARGRFAKPGPSLADSGISERYPEELLKLYEQGMTNPDLMAPEVHVADANNFDTIVFPVNGEAPSWHDITTPDGQRSSAVSVMSKPSPAPPAPKRFGG